jgi:hypothetical protein
LPQLGAQAALEAGACRVHRAFHVRQALVHDPEHLEIGRAEVLGDAVAARIAFRALAARIQVELLLLVEAADRAGQATLHLLRHLTGVADLFHHRAGEQVDRWTGRLGGVEL